MNKENEEKLSKEEIVDIISYHIDNEMIMNVKRDILHNNVVIEGFPLKLSDRLLLITRAVDFCYDGCVILRLEDVTDAYSKEYIAYYEEICKKEGSLDKAKVNNPITDIIDYNTVLKQLIGYEKYISIQCELEDNELDYSIGRISKVEGNIVYFNHFDLEGKWEKEERKIPIEKITMIEYDDNYCNIFSKYLKCPMK